MELMLAHSVNLFSGRIRVFGKASGSTTLATSAAFSPAMESTALLVAVDSKTLVIWSDFVSSARQQTLGNEVSTMEDESERREERENSSAPGEEQPDCDQSCFPPVWIVTSDPQVDKMVREDMPHLNSLFVPFDSDGSYEPRTRWADVLDRFLSDNPKVGVFGLYGEGALPPAILLPDYMDSYIAARDVSGGCGGGMCGDRSGISTVLWPVLSEAVPPTAVISRSRMWWDSGDGGTSNGLGEWMSDKFVAQARHRQNWFSLAVDANRVFGNTCMGASMMVCCRT